MLNNRLVPCLCAAENKGYGYKDDIIKQMGFGTVDARIAKTGKIRNRTFHLMKTDANILIFKI